MKEKKGDRKVAPFIHALFVRVWRRGRVATCLRATHRIGLWASSDVSDFLDLSRRVLSQSEPVTSASISGAVGASQCVIGLPHRTSGFFGRLGRLPASRGTMIRADDYSIDVRSSPIPPSGTFEPHLVMIFQVLFDPISLVLCVVYLDESGVVW